MLKGELATTSVDAILRQLGDGVASGCLHIADGDGDAAKVYLRGGQIYAVQLPGRLTQLGARLVSSGALGPEGLAEALEAQRTELQGWRLGELLVHLGYVDQEVVEAFGHEHIREQLNQLPEIYREILVLRYIDGRSYEEIAQVLGISLAAVDKRLMRGKALLREALRKWLDEYRGERRF